MAWNFLPYPIELKGHLIAVAIMRDQGQFLCLTPQGAWETVPLTAAEVTVLHAPDKVFVFPRPIDRPLPKPKPTLGD